MRNWFKDNRKRDWLADGFERSTNSWNSFGFPLQLSKDFHGELRVFIGKLRDAGKLEAAAKTYVSELQ